VAHVYWGIVGTSYRFGGDQVKELADLAVNYGLAVLVVVYFLFRDYKFNIRLVESLQAIKDAIIETKKE
jgi:hypothetical protein